MTVAIYVRVSTDEQAEQGYSLDSQKERLIAYCVSQGWDDYKLYMDDGYTGTNTNRPALKRMIRHIEENKIKTVIVYKLDRLSRKQKDVLSLLEDVFEKNKVGFRSATEPFDTSTPFGKAMIGVLAVFAQLDRDMIIERLTNGRRQRVSSGKWQGGRVPFGYTWNKDLQELEIFEDEARIVKDIYRMYLDGHSRLAISEWVSKRTNSRVIDHSSIRDILSRPIYKGKLLNSGKEVDGIHDAIIDEKTWISVQEEKKKREDGASPLGEYLLSGLLQCGKCNGGIVHVKRKTNKGGRDYLYELYACKQQHVRKKDRNSSCTLGYVRREQVEKFVIKQIKSIGLFPEKFREMSDRAAGDHNEKESQLEQLQKQLKSTLTGLENLYDAIQSGGIKASSLSERIRKLEEQRDALEIDIDDLIDNTPSQVNSKEAYQIIKNIGEAWDYFTEEEQKAATHKVVKKITLNGKHEDPEIDWFFTN